MIKHSDLSYTVIKANLRQDKSVKKGGGWAGGGEGGGGGGHLAKTMRIKVTSIIRLYHSLNYAIHQMKTYIYIQTSYTATHSLKGLYNPLKKFIIKIDSQTAEHLIDIKFILRVQVMDRLLLELICPPMIAPKRF